MLLKDIFSQVHAALKEKDNIALNEEGEEKTQLSQKHVNIHKCDLCCNEYPFKVNLTEHIENEHTEASEYSCDVCDKKYTRNDNLMRHKRVKHIKECKTNSIATNK